MGKYILKRVLLLIPTILIVCIIVFAIMRMIPGDAVDAICLRLSKAGIVVDPQVISAQLGMDKPAIQQFFIWIGDLLHGNLGDSFFQNESVWKAISRQLPVSLELGVLTLILTNIISIPLGLFCAARQDTLGDKGIRAIAVILMSMPVFWIATIVLVYPSLKWGYSPPMMYVSFFEDPISNMQMFFVPALLGAFTISGMELRTVRTVTLETMRQDYIRTAWAKGVKESTILFKHAFRNAMIPVITVIGGTVAGLIGGSVILENIFNIPGIGQQTVTALGNRDYPLVQGCVLVFSVFVMIVNLIVDIAYKWIDPRITLD